MNMVMAESLASAIPAKPSPVDLKRSRIRVALAAVINVTRSDTGYEGLHYLVLVTVSQTTAQSDEQPFFPYMHRVQKHHEWGLPGENAGSGVTKFARDQTFQQ
ncbi:putative D-xylulose reductase A [Fusarium oxysporum f. sp. albedinis]|nr:putative D-xylulose reductase A [Fusarium oxysporum f. sp. albedinis]